MNTAKSILSTRARALGAYRAVMRAQKTTFQGDFPAQTAARLQAREAFSFNQNLTDGEEIEQAIFEAHDAADFMLKHVVQTNLNKDTGRHELNIRDEHLTKPEDFKE